MDKKSLEFKNNVTIYHDMNSLKFLSMQKFEHDISLHLNKFEHDISWDLTKILLLSRDPWRKVWMRSDFKGSSPVHISKTAMMPDGVRLFK